MSEPLISELASDALFGVDGTELPEPLSEPSGPGVSSWPPLTLPPLPHSRMTPEEIAAALGEDPTQPANQDPEATPAQQGAAPAGATHTDTPPASASPVGVPPVPVPPLTAPPVALTAPLSARSARQGGGSPAASAPGHPSRPLTPTLVPPRVPTPPGKSGVIRYHPMLPVGSRLPRQRDFRRRGPGAPPHLRSNGGATLFFLVAVLVCGLLMYGIITDMVASLSTLVP